MGSKDRALQSDTVRLLISYRETTTKMVQDRKFAAQQNKCVHQYRWIPASSSYSSKGWSSASSSSGSLTSSLSRGDGRAENPSRKVSNLPFGESQTSISRARTIKDGENSFERLFGVPEARLVRPKQLTLTSPSPPQKRKCGKPFSVSPLTGHVIGGDGSQVVPLPAKKVRTPTGICHALLW